MKTNKKSGQNKVQTNPSGITALLCGIFMLCVLPVAFHDALFDINRFKVNLVCTFVPILFIVTLILCLLRGEKMKGIGNACRGVAAPCLFMLLFAIACVISAALRGFEHAVIYGNEGRNAGLWFLLSCVAAFFLLAIWLPECGKLSVAAAVCAAFCGGLGFINMAGFDPFGFYREIGQGQQNIFVSTIGHVDFLGAYLACLLGICGGQALFAKKPGTRRLCAACAVVIGLGAAASRTDNAVMSEALACLMLIALSGDSLSRMALALGISGACCLAYPAMYAAAQASRFDMEVHGLPLLLGETPVGFALGAVLLALCVLCLMQDRRGARAPGRRLTFSIALGGLAVAAVLLVGSVVYFTVFAPEVDIGGLSSFLRFDDSWGTLRGFVYKRALRAYADFGLVEKLFGGGIDLTQRILTPYFDDPAMLVGGIFNDAHCQLLQILLTCGLFGMGSFVALYVSVLVLLLRHAGDDPVLCGALVSLAAYLVVMFINVTQPILIATYFSICGLAVARLRQNEHGGF